MEFNENRIICNILMKSLHKKILWQQTQEIHPVLHKNSEKFITSCFNTTNLDDITFYLYTYRALDLDPIFNYYINIDKIELSLIENNYITWSYSKNGFLIQKLLELMTSQMSSIHKFMTLESCEN